MRDVFLEYFGAGVVVYRPGTTAVAARLQMFDEALAFALAEWPGCEIRVVVSKDVRDLLAAFPPRCPTMGEGRGYSCARSRAKQDKPFES